MRFSPIAERHWRLCRNFIINCRQIGRVRFSPIAERHWRLPRIPDAVRPGFTSEVQSDRRKALETALALVVVSIHVPVRFSPIAERHWRPGAPLMRFTNAVLVRFSPIAERHWRHCHGATLLTGIAVRFSPIAERHWRPPNHQPHYQLHIHTGEVQSDRRKALETSSFICQPHAGILREVQSDRRKALETR